MHSGNRMVRSAFGASRVVALLAGLLLAVGCGGGGGDSSSSAPAAAVAPPVVTTPITQVIDDPGNLGVQIIVTSPNTLTAGTFIVISGATNPSYNGTFAVVSATATTFTIAAAFVGNDITGVWQAGGGLIAGCTTTGATGAITLSSTASRFTGVGPLAVFFDATATTATAAPVRPFHDLEYRWNFGDPLGSPVSGTTWATGSRAGASSRNTATGPVSAHVFERPGTYIVTLTVVDGTNTVSNACTQIAVLDPDVVFAGARTRCFSTTGDFGGCPTGAANVTTSDFVAAMATASAQSRLLFRGGQTFDATAQSTLTAAGPGIIGAYPAGGPAAIVQMMTANTSVFGISTGLTPTLADWRVMDLRLDLRSHTPSARAVRATGDHSQMLFLRLNIHDGRGFSYSDPGVPNWDQIFIVDTTIERVTGGGGAYGVFMSASRLALLGNFIHDISAAEHNTRFPYIRLGIISNNTFSTPGSDKSLIKMHAPDFPTVGAFTEKVVISDNRATSHTNSIMFAIQPQSSFNDERLRDIIIERNYFTADAGFNSPVLGMSGSEFTARNNIANFTGSIARRGFEVARFGGIEPPPEHIRIYNNSFFSSDAFAGPSVIVVGATATNITVKNNLAYAPGMTPTVRMIADSSGGGVVASNNTSNAQMTSTAPAWVSVTPTVVEDYRLTAPSYIAGDATVPVFSDFFRAARPSAGIIDIGATEF